MTVDTHKETLDFQTEARQLLHLMIHSLYSNKEIFLRELISNASDACDKLRFEALTDDALYENDGELKVHVSYDKTSRTVTVTDNGVGMTRQDVIDHIGTIAKSGTRQFFESLSGDQAKDSQLIGQFGVGFYSSFIVADKVTLTTRRAGLGAEHGVCWESGGEGCYTLETVEKVGRGTEIVLHLRKDEDEFLDGYRLRNIIQKYSDSITLPIVMETEGDEDKDSKKIEETVNRASALWMRSKKEISAEDYNEFYKHIAHDFEDPLIHIHSQVEGRQSYTTLFYLPARAPFDLWDRDRRHGIKLYVHRVFIMDDAEQLMPNYLRFVRGIVDSDDLPLNVSREILQRNKQIDLIRGASVKKLLGLLEKLAKNDPEKYQKFWGEFGQVMKEGPAEDRSNSEKIAKLLRFSSTLNLGGTGAAGDSDDKQNISLDDYISRMKEGQDAIYYITADSFAAAKSSPHLEVFLKKDIEVLLLSDRVDEWMLSGLSEYEGKPLRSVAKGDLDLGELEDKEEKAAFEKVADDYKALTDKIQESLGDKVKDVRVTHRLTDSPSCLVVEEEDMANNLRKMLEAAGQKVPVTQPILEINPLHPLLNKIRDEQDEQRFSDWSGILFDQALLSEGGQLEDPALFVRRMNALLLMMDEQSGD